MRIHGNRVRQAKRGSQGLSFHYLNGYGERYIVTFSVGEAWYDSTLATSPEGLPSGEFPWGLGYVALPWKRVINAHYLQPLIEIRRVGDDRSWFGRSVQVYPLSMRQVGDSRTLFRADFRAARNGELFLFVNDAVIPFTQPVLGFDYRYFYENNRGTACVMVESDASANGARTVPLPDSGCR
jgi:hypothetical protein